MYRINEKKESSVYRIQKGMSGNKCEWIFQSDVVLTLAFYH